MEGRDVHVDRPSLVARIQDGGSRLLRSSSGGTLDPAVETVGLIPGDRAATQDRCRVRERFHTLMDSCEKGWTQLSAAEFLVMEEQDEKRWLLQVGARST